MLKNSKHQLITVLKIIRFFSLVFLLLSTAVLFLLFLFNITPFFKLESPFGLLLAGLHGHAHNYQAEVLTAYKDNPQVSCFVIVP